MTDGMDRRRFLKVLGVTGGGAAALSGCSADSAEKLIPYLVPPENQIPGIATWYATTCRECSAGCGLHVRVREGRAVKVEGNPDHPINQGKLCARGQASLQGLYNPDRVRSPMVRGADGTFQEISWDDAIARIVTALQAEPGDRVRFLTGHESGSFDRLVDAFMARLGSVGRVSFEPFGYEGIRQGCRIAFGVDVVPQYDLSAAEYIISFGADFLETWMSPVEHTRGFVRSHAFADGRMGRYVHVEPRMSMTGMNADEWVAPRPGTEALVALAMAHVIASEGLGSPPPDAARARAALEPHAPAAVAEACGVPAETIERLAREFAAVPSVALPGGVGSQHEQAHITAAAANVLNYVAGNVGRSVFLPAQGAQRVGSYADLLALTSAMETGAVGVLFVHGSNPAHGCPAGERWVAAMERVGLTVSFSRFMDETAVHADLVLPDHDPLEQWNDHEPRPGMATLVQPIMRPLFDTRQTGDVLLAVARGLGGSLGSALSAATYKDHVQDSWRERQQRLGDRRAFEGFWDEALRRGGAWQRGALQSVRLAPSVMQLATPGPWPAVGDLAVLVYPSSALYDGRGANRPWLQELADPVSKIAWSTWVEVHPETAAERGLHEGDIVRLTTEYGSVEVPVFLYPGIRADTVAIPLGQGHTEFGRYAAGHGANAFRLLRPEPTDFGGIGFLASGTLEATDGHERLATNVGKPRQMGRGIAQAVTLAALSDGRVEAEHGEHAAPIPEKIEHVLDQWQEAQYAEQERGDYAGDQPRWGLSIDLSRCTGCSACVTACHAENNIPHVGAELVRRGREMSWLRIERYFEGGEHGEPFEARVVPMTCQQCSNAPCEPVCPVFAAYHTPDGLNGQVYNRCVGTRYCSNNCPYKVRYFNWFEYMDPAYPMYAWPEPLNWQLNPDVTVRSKGVMEKCTFCVQRIRDKQHLATLEDRELRDGEIRTACEQTCPADAIVFGDLNDPTSRVSRLAAEERGYHVLESLNTRPAITYLKKVRNVVEA
ncbi:MAG TPA: molybdopterin-dependent oxidoreductase [Gemmatimonadales bacterium]|jgi:molybdopterin-containing oxidoreductase family iron-sulfur binding subunit